MRVRAPAQGRFRVARLVTFGAATALIWLGGGAAAKAQGPEPQTSLADISDEVMCTVCGVPLELAQEAPQAEAQRDFIRGLIAEGETKDEIKDALVDEYGENVLAVPATDGFGLAAWLVPGIALVAAVAGIALALRRWRRNRAPATVPTPEARPDAEADKRLDADLARYDL